MERTICRLLGYASAQPTTFQEVLGQDFAQFVQLANKHGDGWGLATSDEVIKEPVAATKSSHFASEIAHHKSNDALLHFRWATPGLVVSQVNTHPFQHQGISFIHNGSLSPADQLDSLIDPALFAHIKGTTDSERYFFYVVTEIQRHGFLDGVRRALSFMKKEIIYSSLNCMIMNEDFLIAACIYNPEKIPELFKDHLDYYHLKYSQHDGAVIVGSSGWNQSGWNEIPNGSILVVEKSSLRHEIQSIT